MKFNKLTTENFTARLAQANIVIKTDFDAQLVILNKKFNSGKTKGLLVKNKLKKLQAFDSSFFRSKILFEEDCTQNYLVFESIRKYLKKISNTNNTSERRSK